MGPRLSQAALGWGGASRGRGRKGRGSVGPPGTRSPTFFRLAPRPPGPPGQEAMRQQRLLGVLVLRAQGQGAEQLRVVGRAAVVEHVRQLQRLHVAPLSEHLQVRRDPGGSGPCWGSTHPPQTHPARTLTHIHTPWSLTLVQSFSRAPGTSPDVFGSGPQDWGLDIWMFNPHALAPGLLI